MFRERQSLDTYLSYSLQLAKLSARQITDMKAPRIPRSVQACISAFDGSLSDNEYKSPRFAYLLDFSRRVANRPGTADIVVEFVSPGSDKARSIPPDRWVVTDRERPKCRARHVVKEVAAAGFPKFGMYQHTQLWKAEDAKDERKGFGIRVEGEWFWYESWVDHVKECCAADGDRYR